MKIIKHSSFLCNFLLSTKITFSKPQMKNFKLLADAMIFHKNIKKTIRLVSKTYLQNAPDEYALAGFFHTSTWDPIQRERELAKWAQEEAAKTENIGNVRFLVISGDDTIVEKYKDSQFELAEYIYDHAKGRYVKGVQFISLRVSFADNSSLTIALRPYISKKKVKELNKKYGANKYIFKTKNEIFRELLEEFYAKLPRNLKIYVSFDSWFASRENINFCTQRGATVICQIKSNRIFNGKAVSKQFSTRKKDWVKKRIRYASSIRHYLIKEKDGQLRGLDTEKVKVIASIRHYGQKHPVYFLCTDPEMSVVSALEKYATRWQCETDYQYLKMYLGLSDFRVRSALAIQRYTVLVHFIDLFLQYRQKLRMQKLKRYVPLSEIIDLHISEHEQKSRKFILDCISNKKERRQVAKLLAA